MWAAASALQMAQQGLPAMWEMGGHTACLHWGQGSGVRPNLVPTGDRMMCCGRSQQYHLQLLGQVPQAPEPRDGLEMEPEGMTASSGPQGGV